MKADALAHEISVSQALVRGACPICGVLKEFQSALAEKVQVHADLHLCNFHTWLLARSAPANGAAAVYLKLLEDSPAVKVEASDCGFCQRILEQEKLQLRELVKQMQRAMFVQWMKSQGSVCLNHSRKLQDQAPLKMRRLIDEIVERTRAELKQELGNFLEHTKQGDHAGGGILGRAAEFLVSQRGM
jgi:predicted unusual protein kinase regulating ubiquinone biosynthesis (AarF/ABC1/UbiB family)